MANRDTHLRRIAALRQGVKPAVMLVLAVASGCAASVLFQSTNTKPAHAGFDGGVRASLRDGSVQPADDERKPTLHLRIGSTSGNPSSRDDLDVSLQDKTFSITLDSLWAGNFGENVAEIGLDGDTRLADIQLQVVDASTDLDPRVTMFIREGIAHSQIVTISSNLAGPADGYYSVIVRGTLAKVVGVTSGAMTDLRTPECITTNLAGGCTIAAGDLGPDETITYADQPPLLQKSLVWHGKARLDALGVQITDAAVTEALDRNLFLAGALVGVAGGALIELAGTILEATSEIRKQRTAIPSPGPSFAGGKPMSWVPSVPIRDDATHGDSQSGTPPQPD